MKYFLVFDIETAPIEWEKFSESQKAYWLKNSNTKEEIEAKMFQRSLTPLTGKVLCIGIMILEYSDSNWTIVKKGVLANDPNIESTNLNVFFSESKCIYEDFSEECINSDNDTTAELATEVMLLDDVKMQLSNEKRMLQDFWKIIARYKNPTLITFNGRNFDVPFLMLRSAIYHIRPPYNLMQGTKFNYPFHIDLIDELTFFNPSVTGATKKFNFDFYAHSFGIVSPKAQGVDGYKVPDMYAEGKIKEIAEYCMRDVRATWELFQFWLKYLCFKAI